MRRLVIAIALAWSPATAQTTVATDKPVNGATVELARLTTGGSFCRAPLGPETFFELDSSQRLFLVQPELRRAARFTRHDFLAYRSTRDVGLQRLAASNQALANTPDVDPKFKAALKRYGNAPNPRLAWRTLRAPSQPATGAKPQPRLIALERALAAARSEIARAGLSNTLVGAIATCVVDVSEFPRTATQASTGTARVMTEQSSQTVEQEDATRYPIVPLYDLLAEFGQPLMGAAR